MKKKYKALILPFVLSVFLATHAVPGAAGTAIYGDLETDMGMRYEFNTYENADGAELNPFDFGGTINEDDVIQFTLTSSLPSSASDDGLPPVLRYDVGLVEDDEIDKDLGSHSSYWLVAPANISKDGVNTRGCQGIVDLMKETYAYCSFTEAPDDPTSPGVIFAASGEKGGEDFDFSFIYNVNGFLDSFQYNHGTVDISVIRKGSPIAALRSALAGTGLILPLTLLAMIGLATFTKLKRVSKE